VKFWENPEFVRHLRADLRGPRAITMGTLTLVICGLAGLSCWGSAENLNEFFKLFHYWLVGIQFTIMGFWCSSACGQAISRERDLKTFDFLRTTRLTAGELAIGKIFGAPIMAYFVTACSLPISIIAGILGGIPAATLLGIYVLLFVFALFVSVMGLWISMLLEKSSAAAAVVLILLPTAMGFSFTGSPFPGFSAISIFPAILSLYHSKADAVAFLPTIFGFQVPFVVLTILLYAAFGVWFVLMTVRNLKKEREEMRLLSHWQAIGMVAFLNVLFYALLDPKRLIPVAQFDYRAGSAVLHPWEAAVMVVVLNASILFLVGCAVIASKERLKVWWRQRVAGEVSYLSRDGFVWPWLAMGAAVGYALLAGEAFGLSSNNVSWRDWELGFSAVLFLNILIFIIRDITFLQWCALTRMKRPLFKGFLYLTLYYVAVAIIGSVMSLASETAGSSVMGLFSPWQMMGAHQTGLSHVQASYVGMALQAVFSAFLVTLIARRLSRPPVLIPATSS
jgi:hypothetical protein